MLRAFVRMIILTTLLVTAIQSSTLAAWRSFRVMNRTGQSIIGLYITATNAWGKNLLSNSLKNGATVNVPYRNELSTNFALRIILPSGAWYAWTGNNRQNLGGVRMITFYRDGDTFRIRRD